METLYIKKQTKPEDAESSHFVVPAVGIKTKEGIRLIPHPYGNETTAFETLEQTLENVHRAGYAAEYDGKYYPIPQARAAIRPAANAPSRYRLLGMNALEEAIPLLREQLNDSVPSVVASAAYALGALQDEGAITGLIHSLNHDDATVRKNAAEALAKLGKPAYHAIQLALKDKHWLVRHSALSAVMELIHIQLDATSDLLSDTLPLLKDDSWLVRSQAANVLAEAAKAYQTLKEKELTSSSPPSAPRETRG